MGTGHPCVPIPPSTQVAQREAVAHNSTGTKEGDIGPIKGEGSILLGGDEARPLAKGPRELARVPASHPDTLEVSSLAIGHPPTLDSYCLLRGEQHRALHGSRAPSATSPRGPGWQSTTRSPIQGHCGFPNPQVLVPESSQEAKYSPARMRYACVCMRACVCVTLYASTHECEACMCMHMYTV